MPAVRVCKSCGFRKLPVESEFCSKCGKPLPHPVKKSSNTKAIVWTVVAMLVIGQIAEMGEGSGEGATDGTHGEAHASTEDELGDRLTAYQMAQDFVKRFIVSPASAKFPGAVWDGAIDHVSLLDDGEHFHVNSYFDSQNRLGAMLRSEYFCQLRKCEGEEWVLDALMIDGEAVYANQEIVDAVSELANAGN